MSDAAVVRRGVLQARLSREAGAHSDAPDREWAPYTFTLTADGVLACAAGDGGGTAAAATAARLFAVRVCGVRDAAGGAGVVAELADGARLTLAPLHPADGLAWRRALAGVAAAAAPGETARGWLKVRGVTKQWAVRLFVLRPPVLAAYRDEDAAARGSALFAAHLRGCVCHERVSKKDGFCFMVEHARGRPIYLARGPRGEALPKVLLNADELILRAPAAADGRVWLERLARAIALADADAESDPPSMPHTAADQSPPSSSDDDDNEGAAPQTEQTEQVVVVAEKEEGREEEVVEEEVPVPATPRSSSSSSSKSPAHRHRSRGTAAAGAGGTDAAKEQQLRQLRDTVEAQEATLARLAHQVALLEQQLAAQAPAPPEQHPPPCTAPPAWHPLLPMVVAVLLVLVAVVSTSLL